MRWGGDMQGGEPYVFEDPERAGARVGFEVEIAEALAKALGVRAEFVQNDWSTLVPTLERGTIDIVLNGLEITDARQARIRFSRPYYLFAERVSVRREDQRAWGLSDMKGRRVGTLANSLAWDLLGEVAAERIPYEGVEEPYKDLATGRLEAVLMDDIIADRYGVLPELRVAGDVAIGKYAIGLRKGDGALSTAIDDALAELLENGQLRSILQRWQLDGPRQAGLAQGGAGVVSPAIGQLASTSDAKAPPVGRPRRLTAGHVVLFLEGAAVTLFLSVSAMVIAIGFGLLLALARLPSRVPWRRLVGKLATVYVEVFRGTPLLLQLYVLYFGLAPVYPLHPFAAAILGMGLNYAAYEAEIYRAGMQAVPRGQIDAGLALGMSGPLVFRRVMFPQAFRFSLPGITNDFIALLKDSSLVSVITVVELTKRMTIVAVDAGGWLLPGLLCASLYLGLSYPLSRLARRLEDALGPKF